MTKEYSEYEIYHMKGDWDYYYVYRTRLDTEYPWHQEGYIIGPKGYTAYAYYGNPEPTPEKESRIWGNAAKHQIENKRSITEDTDESRAAREALRLYGEDNKLGVQTISHIFPEQHYIDWPFEE